MKIKYPRVTFIVVAVLVATIINMTTKRNQQAQTTQKVAEVGEAKPVTVTGHAEINFPDRKK